MTESKKELWSAIRKAQLGLNSVSKDATNDWGKYGYTSAEQMISSCRRTMLENDLVFSRTHWDLQDSKVYSHFTIFHTESGQYLEFGNQMLVVGGKNPDKSVLAALTTAMNYALRDILLIPRVEAGQPEIDNRSHDAMLEPSPQVASQTRPSDRKPPKKAKRAPDWMSVAFGAVLGQKDDPDDFVKRLLGAAESKYESKFKSVEDLPEEYLSRVFEHHGWEVSVKDQEVRKVSEDNG